MNPLKNEQEYCYLLLKHLATAAYGSSTLRGQPEGTKKTIKAFLEKRFANDGNILKELKLIKNQPSFDRWHKNVCNALCKELPEGCSKFGISRKSINIYLRVLAANYTLCTEYKIFNLIHKFLHVPLDSLVMKKIKASSDGACKDLKTSIKKLDVQSYEIYQKAALQQSLKLLPKAYAYRSNLDYIYWGTGANKSRRV